MIDNQLLVKAYHLMSQANAMAQVYEANRSICKYVHSTSRGHEAIQLATAFHLQPQDYVSPYYRDESLLLGLGFTPYELMLQLLAKGNDIFTGGREYYSHPNYNGKDKPGIIHQSSATGMQAIPTTGIAQGIQYLEKINSPLLQRGRMNEAPVVICSLGDASVTEGEVSEAFQFAVLKQLPVIYLVQDNNWGISVTSSEARAMNIKGIGEAKAITITAALELGRRRQASSSLERAVVASSRDIAQYLQTVLKDYRHEVFAVIFLNRANKVRHFEIVSEGGITGTVADPRVILKKALEEDAVSIILCHNHPSGSLRPSRADEDLTAKIKEAARFFDIRVVDHIIVSENGYYSFADEGIL